MKWVLYNPMSLDHWRAEEVSRQFASVDIIVLPGTQQRSWWEQHPALRFQREFHQEISWGWRPRHHTNKSAGVSFFLHERHDSCSIRDVFSPPASLSGRGVAVRLRPPRADILFVALYTPPRCSVRHIEVTEASLKWANGLVSRIGTRTIPVLAADLNDQFGMRRDVSGQAPDRMVGDAQPAVGKANTRRCSGALWNSTIFARRRVSS